VSNTNLPHIVHCFRDIAFDKSKIAMFGYPSSFNPTDGAVSYIISSYVTYRSKPETLGYISIVESLGISSTTFYTQCTPRAIEFAEITQNRAPFPRYSLRWVQNRYIWLPLLCLTPPAEGFLWDNLRNILCGRQGIAKVSNAVEILPTISTA